MKHNKKRNTAFLFECLVKELTKATLRSDTKTKHAIVSILREHFHTNSVLQKELTLYKTLCEISEVEKTVAEKILVEVKRVYHTLGEQDIFDEQTEVIKKINTDLSKSVFKNFVSNYKTLASISQLFNPKTPIPNRVLLEQNIIDSMCACREKTDVLKPIDNLTYNVFVKKFNEKYGTTLNESQKDLISRYVVLSPESATDFKMYVSDEIGRLKEKLSAFHLTEEAKKDDSLVHKNLEILEILSDFSNQQINDNMIKKILKIQGLVSEI